MSRKMGACGGPSRDSLSKSCSLAERSAEPDGRPEVAQALGRGSVGRCTCVEGITPELLARIATPAYSPAAGYHE
jgi:hypothetical protein